MSSSEDEDDNTAAVLADAPVISLISDCLRNIQGAKRWSSRRHRPRRSVYQTQIQTDDSDELQNESEETRRPFTTTKVASNDYTRIRTATSNNNEYIRARQPSQSELANAGNTARDAAVDFEQRIAEWKAKGATTPSPTRFALFLTDRFLCGILDPLPKTPGVAAVRKEIVSQIEQISSMPTIPDVPSPAQQQVKQQQQHAIVSIAATRTGMPRSMRFSTTQASPVRSSTQDQSKTMPQRRSLFSGHAKNNNNNRKLLAALGHLAQQETDRRQEQIPKTKTAVVKSPQSSEIHGPSIPAMISKQVNFELNDSRSRDEMLRYASARSKHEMDSDPTVGNDHTAGKRVNNLRKRFEELKATNASTYKRSSMPTSSMRQEHSEQSGRMAALDPKGNKMRNSNNRTVRFGALLERAQLQSVKIKEMKESEDARKQLAAIRVEQKEMSDLAPEPPPMMLPSHLQNAMTQN